MYNVVKRLISFLHVGLFLHPAVNLSCEVFRHGPIERLESKIRS